MGPTEEPVAVGNAAVAPKGIDLCGADLECGLLGSPVCICCAVPGHLPVRFQRAMALAFGKAVPKAEAVNLKEGLQEKGLDALFPTDWWPCVNVVGRCTLIRFVRLGRSLCACLRRASLRRR